MTWNWKCGMLLNFDLLFSMILETRYYFMLLVVFGLTVNCCICAYVSWELKSSPAIFGSTVYLLCNISDDAHSCLQSKRQWLGGPEYGPLCQDEGCGNGTKYEIMKQLNMCSYTLMIHKFSVVDVECDYTCSYGVINMRNTLKLNSDDFVYIPTEEDKEIQSAISGTSVIFSLLIKKIYPSPQCFVFFQNVNLSHSVEIVTTKPGHLYVTTIHVNGSMPSCSGYLVIKCIIGNQKINVAKQEINTCEDVVPVYVSVGCGIVATVIIIIVIVYLERRIGLNNKSPTANSGDINKESQDEPINFEQLPESIGTSCLLQDKETTDD